MNSKIIFSKICDLSLINLNDPENSEIRFMVDEIKYFIKIPKSKIKLISNILKNEIENNIKYKNVIIRNDEILKAIEKLPLKRGKNGDGRKAEWIARQFKIGVATIYQAQRVLRDAPSDILRKVRSGKMPFKTAYNLITKKQ